LYDFPNHLASGTVFVSTVLALPVVIGHNLPIPFLKYYPCRSYLARSFPSFQAIQTPETYGKQKPCKGGGPGWEPLIGAYDLELYRVIAHHKQYKMNKN
jgi:hypothetical protein